MNRDILIEKREAPYSAAGNILTHQFGTLEVKESRQTLWQYVVKDTQRVIEIAPPVFEINERTIIASLKNIHRCGEARKLDHGVIEAIFIGELTEAPGVRLQLRFRLVPDNAIIRFQYELQSEQPIALTKKLGRDNLEYFKYSTRDFEIGSEIRLGEFDESIHSFRLVEHPILPSAYANSLQVMGPILISSNDKEVLLGAYEHGSQVPDAFVQFELSPEHSVAVRAVKGNYYINRMVAPDRPYETIWFQFAAMEGTSDDLASQYRHFVLRHLTPNAASRTPYIFYNTWSFQERNRYWNKKTYLDSMTDARILQEIEIAHQVGVDVFVIDTGWFTKAGDWEVHPDRFSDRLAPVKKRLDEHGMKLGLWFSPADMAVTAKLAEHHLNERMSKNGKVGEPHPVWGSEDSYTMCIVSSYWESFADVLIGLCKEIGVTYFKWDAIGQYGCDDPHHFHGDTSESAQERENSYAFEQVRYLRMITDKVCQACPEAIVDFDITEGWRSVGLAFLASGKYFLVNNGPYFSSLDFPADYFSPDVYSNVLVFPGPARPRLCRAPLDFDKWIPSVLFLTHYLPDDPKSSQLDNIASLILGQNGIWGDLLNISPEGIERFSHFLSLFKHVSLDITESDPIRTGIVGGSPEVHEKINSQTGRGVVCLFASARGNYSYITHHSVVSQFCTHDGVQVTLLKNGQARIDFEATEPFSARMVFFGVSK
jgi:alpha-galactosidase